ncbi:MAG TPA: prepilin peptidase [Verrucomicrobiae bacterium]|nr:prepilin peptidase [Verrucomicrobiae bacterium]
MPDSFFVIAAAVLGAVIGSFLNVVILRDSRRSTILTGRSACMHCGHELSWYELIPLLSFVMQGGRCRKCKKALSWQYPLGELVVAALAVFALWYGYFLNGSWVLAAGVFIVLATFFVLSGTDFRTMEIRPEYTIFAMVVAALSNVLSGKMTLTQVALGAAVGVGIILFLTYGWKLLTGKLGMGEGDAWIVAAVGALVGYPAIFPALFAAVLLGAVVGVIILARLGRTDDVAMPFGPYLAMGGLIALVWGQAIIQWYTMGI